MTTSIPTAAIRLLPPFPAFQALRELPHREQHQHPEREADHHAERPVFPGDLRQQFSGHHGEDHAAREVRHEAAQLLSRGAVTGDHSAEDGGRHRDQGQREDLRQGRAHERPGSRMHRLPDGPGCRLRARPGITDCP